MRKKEPEAKLQQEEYERQQEEYQKRLREYEQYLYEEEKGDAFSLDILFTDAKSTTWRITACGYADEIIALHCVKEDIEVTPVSIFSGKEPGFSGYCYGENGQRGFSVLFQNRLDKRCE